MAEDKFEKTLSRNFYYEGPKTPVRAHGCMSCVSAAAKLCMHHEGGNAQGCHTCAAARTGHCSTHGRGLKGALDEHETNMKGEDAKIEWAGDRAYIEAKASRIPDDAKVKVHATGYSGILDSHPRLSAVEVIQLKP